MLRYQANEGSKDRCLIVSLLQNQQLFQSGTDMFSYSVGHFNDVGSKESYPLRMQEASEPSKRRTFHVSILGDGSVEVTEDISGWRSHV